jgi:hypothetical protein
VCPILDGGLCAPSAAATPRGRNQNVSAATPDQASGVRRERYSWSSSLADPRRKCDAVLVVVALRPGTARASSKPILTGHPGFILKPIVIGPDTTPVPDGPGTEQASAELTVLAVLTGALDLGDAETRTFVLRTIADLDTERRATYTRLIRVTASEAVQRALEELMATVFRDEFVDGLLDRGRAEGEARGRAEGEARGRAEGEAGMLLRFLAARGFTVPDDIQERVRTCQDTGQLEAWGDLAAAAESLEAIFGS